MNCIVFLMSVIIHLAIAPNRGPTFILNIANNTNNNQLESLYMYFFIKYS